MTIAAVFVAVVNLTETSTHVAAISLKAVALAIADCMFQDSKKQMKKT